MNTVLLSTKLLSGQPFTQIWLAVSEFTISLQLWTAIYSIEHALTCKTVGFPAVRHNEVRDITATLLTEVCHGVTTEPHLQPLSGESLFHRSANTQDGA